MMMKNVAEDFQLVVAIQLCISDSLQVFEELYVSGLYLLPENPVNRQKLNYIET